MKLPVAAQVELRLPSYIQKLLVEFLLNSASETDGSLE
jgi:hypothetical protein